MSASRAFLRPAMKRSNVTVLTGAHVTRILFEGKRAIGVEYQRRHHQIRPRRARSDPFRRLGQLAAAAAAFRHRRPLRLLNSLDIPVIHANANVGQHLQDHQGINYTYKAKVPTLNQTLRPWWGKLMVGLQYLLFRTGPLSISMNQGGGFFRTSDKYKRPNMQLYFQVFSTVIPKPGERPILTPDPVAGLFHRPVQLPHLKPWPHCHQVAQSVRTSTIIANVFSINMMSRKCSTR